MYIKRYRIKGKFRRDGPVLCIKRIIEIILCLTKQTAITRQNSHNLNIQIAKRYRPISIYLSSSFPVETRGLFHVRVEWKSKLQCAV